MEIPRHWRLKAQRYRLEGRVCPVCGELTLPPRPMCMHCITPPVQNVFDRNMVLPALLCHEVTSLLKEAR